MPICSQADETPVSMADGHIIPYNIDTNLGVLNTAMFHDLLLHFTQGAGHNPVRSVEKYAGPNALPARGWILWGSEMK